MAVGLGAIGATTDEETRARKKVVHPESTTLALGVDLVGLK